MDYYYLLVKISHKFPTVFMEVYKIFIKILGLNRNFPLHFQNQYIQ